MLDYEIDKYRLEFRPLYCRTTFYKDFGSEDDAVCYIKSNYKNWANYKLQKIQNAIIDL